MFLSTEKEGKLPILFNDIRIALIPKLDKNSERKENNKPISLMNTDAKYKDILYNTGIFYNNYKWSITIKNCESLYCTPITYIILYIGYMSIKNKVF